jgi:hypothetical protein
MTRAIRWLAVMPLVIVLGACATAGNERLKEQTPESVAQLIQEGRTTKAEVLKSLGNADHVSFTDSGNEIWTYRYARATPQGRNFIPFVSMFSRGYDVATKELVVMFGATGTVNKMTMRESQDVRRQGLLE